MKKILLASTVVLSMAGISKTTVLAEENQATNKVQSSEKTLANGTSKEAKEKKQAQGQQKKLLKRSTKKVGKKRMVNGVIMKIKRLLRIGKK